MKKSILNIGKTLNKIEQKEINGGFGGIVFVCTLQTEGFQCFDTPDGSPGFCSEGICYDC